MAPPALGDAARGRAQGTVALALLGIYASNADWSLLIVAAIAGGAALCALADARRASRS